MALTSSLPVSAADGRQIGIRGFRIAEGANLRMGTAVLVAGTVTVNNTSVTATTRVLLTTQVAGGTPGALRLGTVVPATSFVITSSSGTDTSTVLWILIEPA